MWALFRVFIEFVTTLLLFYVLVFWPQGMWDLSSLTGIKPAPPEGEVSTVDGQGSLCSVILKSMLSQSKMML